MARRQEHWSVPLIALVLAVPLGLIAASYLSGKGRHDPATEPHLPDVSEPTDLPVARDGAAIGPIEITAPDLPSDELTEAVTIQTEILRTVEDLARSKSGLGYDAGKYFTEDLSYGDATIKANGAPETMCVAAVTEVMIRALTSWSEKTGNADVLQTFPHNRWMGGNVTNLRPWLFVWDIGKPIPAYNRNYGVGTRDALILFGMGRSVAFEDAQPGDFVNFNRTRTGHAAVFLGFLKKDHQPADTYGPDVVGFKYFSAQVTDTNGLGYKHAYFKGYCPGDDPELGTPDCHIQRDESRGLLTLSRLNEPTDWRTGDTQLFLEALLRDGKSIEEIERVRYDGEEKPVFRSAQAIAPYLEELEPRPAISFSGEME